jgi:hypothetical protein
MRVLCFLLLASIGLGTLSTALGQAPAQSQPQPQQRVMRIQDGGTSGRMESIFIPPKAGVPVSFALVTEWTRPMPGGGNFTVTNQRRIVRDSKGRIYQERWLLVPKGSDIKSQMDIFQITDPEQHTWYNCETATKVCNLFRYGLSTTDSFQPAIGPSGPLPDGRGFRQHDDLGAGSSDGIDTHGYRETVTINAGMMGNDKPMISTREFWYSPQLAINLVSTVDNAMTGKQVFTAKDISTAEPDPSAFEIPADYKVVDRLNEQQ